MCTSRLRRVGSAGSIPLFLILITATTGPTRARAAEPDSETVGLDDTPDGDEPARSVGKVAVTATRSERSVLETPGHVTTIEREEIERSGARTVPELLRRQPGLFVTNSTTTPAGVQIEARGFNNGGALGSSLLVQVDGRRMNEADTSNTDWSMISLDEVESIEIVRGPASALYGDNAVGGVINIRTRPMEGPPRVTLHGRVGRYQAGQGSLRAAGSVGRVTGSLFVDGLSTNGYRKGADFDRENVKGTLQTTLAERVVVGASGGWHHDDRSFPGALDANEIDLLGRRARQPGTDQNGSHVVNRFVLGWLDAELAENVELRVRPYYRWRDDDAVITTRFQCPFTMADVSSDFSTALAKNSAGVEGQVQVDREIFGHRNRLIVGFDFLHEKVDRKVVSSDACFGVFTTLSDLERDVYAGFFQEEFNILANLLLSAGLRFDRAELDLTVFDPGTGTGEEDDPTFNVWSPRAALTWVIRPEVSVYGSYSQGFRLPNFDEDLPIFGFRGPVIPDLEEQTSDSFEVGAKLRHARVDANLALYWMNVRNEIFFNPDPLAFANANFDRVRHRGVEASVYAWVLDWLAAYASYTFEDVKIRKAEDPAFVGRRLPITPKNRGTLGFFARLPWNFELTAHANLVGERKVANDFFGDVAPLHPYGTFDLLAAWRPSLGEHVSAAITAGFYNITGEEFEDFGAKSSFSNRVVFNPSPAFTWDAGIQLTIRR